MKGKTFSGSGAMFALIAATGLGAVTTQAKIVYADGGNALTMMLWRFVISTIVIGFIVLARRPKFQIDQQHKKPAFMLALIWSGSMICYLVSVETISVSLAVLILYSYPLLVMLISLATGRMRLTHSVIAAFTLAFIGIGLMLGGGEIRIHPMGIGLAVLAASGAAYTFLKGSEVAPKLDPFVLTFWINLVGVFMILPLVLGQFSMPRSSLGLWCLGGATLCYVVAIVAQFAALARMTAAKAAFIFNFEPVVSILLAVLILSESLSVIQWTGAAIVVCVLFLFGFLDNVSSRKKMT
jgi:drug/metabolite transporter (DMT)-like permease